LGDFCIKDLDAGQADGTFGGLLVLSCLTSGKLRLSDNYPTLLEDWRLPNGLEITKFEISEVGTLIPGLEIRDNRILLQGKDISTLPDTVDKLTTANHELVQANQDLSNQLKQVNSLLDQLTKNRDGANQQSDKADQFVKTLQAQQQQIQTTVAAAQNSARALTAPAVAPTEATLTYRLVFSADKSKVAAMEKVDKVVQRLLCAGPSAQDHKIVCIDDEASAEALLKAELLPPQHKPAHVQICVRSDLIRQA
jgi:hypothetical protein